MSSKKIPVLVSCQWLKDVITKQDPASNVVLLETSFEKREDGITKFAKSHIPTARYFDCWEGVNPTQLKPRDLPDATSFEKHAQSNGINSDSHVVIYDKEAVFYSVRLWYTFKAFGHNNVSILEGSMMYWTQQNFPVESGEAPHIEPGNFKVTPPSELCFKTYEQLCDDRNKDVQIVDTRLKDDFTGDNKDIAFISKWGLETAGLPVPDYMPNGHVPGAKNIPFTDFMDHNTTCILPDDKLVELLKTNGVDIDKPIVGMCYTGVTGCYLSLVKAKLQGTVEQFSLYVGSWTEYSQRASSKEVETGESKALGKL